MRQDITVGEGAASRRIAVDARAGRGPTVVWLGGFRSDMTGTKAEALDGWAADEGRAFLRFDYAAHGRSGGRFEDCTVSTWLADAREVVGRFAQGRPILVGSSMGGWIALLLTRALRAEAPERAPGGLVLLAPAVDFTERLMWDGFGPAERDAIMRDGVWHRPSAYADEPYPITRTLIEDGRRHLLLEGAIETGCPVHVIQGMADPDVPWQHAMRLVEHLPGESVQVTTIRDGDHRLSRPEDLERLICAVEGCVLHAEEAGGPAQLRLTV